MTTVPTTDTFPNESTYAARVAQLDRASASGAEGHRFESCRARLRLPPPLPCRAGTLPPWSCSTNEPSERHALGPSLAQPNCAIPDYTQDRTLSMPRRTSWSELAVGLVALAVIAGVGLIVLVFARVGTLHGSTFHLYALTAEARGIIRSSEVWLGGQKVGVVKDVHFLPPSASDSNRVLIDMDVLSSAQSEIRLNSTAQVRAGGTLIGAPVVYLSIGTSAARSVKPGDTIRALPQSDMETVTSEFATASRQFPDIISNIKLLDQELHGVHGAIGAFTAERGGRQLERMQYQEARLGARLRESTGTVGLALSQRTLTDRARLAMARADSIRALVASPNTSYGRFRRDSTLFREVADVRNELDIVRAQMRSPEGTLGRIRADSALLQAVADTRREMTLILNDLHQRPLRYIHF